MGGGEERSRKRRSKTALSGDQRLCPVGWGGRALATRIGLTSIRRNRGAGGGPSENNSAKFEKRTLPPRCSPLAQAQFLEGATSRAAGVGFIKGGVPSGDQQIPVKGGNNRKKRREGVRGGDQQRNLTTILCRPTSRESKKKKRPRSRAKLKPEHLIRLTAKHDREHPHRQRKLRERSETGEGN